MHNDELPISADLVSRLLAEQFPAAAHLPIIQFRSAGTVNAVFRVGDHLIARLPRVMRWTEDLDRELRWLPVLAPHVPLSVPESVFAGSRTDYYPSSWAVYRWIDGAPYADGGVENETDAARDLARFITDLRRIDTTGAPHAGRRPLLELDTITREAITASDAVIDARSATSVWEDAIRTPPWAGIPVWVHTDLLRPNLLVRDGRLAAVIDWGGAGAGDPAADIIAAWSVFGASGRQAFRASIGVDDETWRRARGFALHQAALIIPYYRESNPEFVTTAVRTVEQIVSDPI